MAGGCRGRGETSLLELPGPQAGAGRTYLPVRSVDRLGFASAAAVDWLRDLGQAAPLLQA